MSPDLPDTVIAHRREISGILIFFIVVIVGGAMLWIALDHSNTQYRAAQAKANRLAAKVLEAQRTADHKALVELYQASVSQCRATKAAKLAANRNTDTLKRFIVTARAARRVQAQLARTQVEKDLHLGVERRLTELLEGQRKVYTAYDCFTIYQEPAPLAGRSN